MSHIEFEQFARALEEVRSEHGMSNADLARASGLTPSHITRLEQGDRRPSRSTVIAISQALGLDRGQTNRLLLLAEHAPVEMEQLVEQLAASKRIAQLAEEVVLAQIGEPKPATSDLMAQIRKELASFDVKP